ncbi:hypothetical protein Q4485_03340 [Granulosicoccaceae sp. 1_MG-2023]|nr:hypothetical protein [Granulosicoccaceae sp. 1_MG-2023]
MTVQAPWWLIAAAGLLIAALLLRLAPREDSWKNVIGSAMLARLRPPRQIRNHTLPYFVLAAGIAFALSDPVTPQSGSDDTYVAAETWWALVDVSASMDETDIHNGRLHAVRTQLTALREAAGPRPLGLALFAGDAFTAHPATQDHQAFADFAAALHSSLVPVAGSRPARALALLAGKQADTQTLRKRIWLFTDGDGIDDTALAQAAALAAQGDRLDVVLSSTAAPAAARRLADSGGGELWQMDVLGQLPAAPFDSSTLARARHELSLTLGGYRHWSQWLLLCLLPLCWQLLRRPL